jgi:uncharacterized linocin/CFP29 family protein
MADYLMRSDAPLSEDEWEAVDGTVVHTARQFLVGRRLLDLVGPFGAGLEVIPVGTGENRRQVPLTVIDEEFKLKWRDVEASRKLGLPLELGEAAKAAMLCAKAEDEMVLGGLWDAADKSVPLGAWSEGQGPLAAVVAATEALFSDNFFGPYAVVLSPGLYVDTQRVGQGMGRLVADLIKGVAEGGIHRSQLLGDGQGFVLALGSHNFDLVVGQDLVTAYEGNEGLDHCFRILETAALRVKRAGAVCKLEG